LKRNKTWKPKFDFDSSIELTKNKLCPFCKNYTVDFLGLPRCKSEECVFEEDEEKETE
jgi:hypothetical protein